MGFKMTKSLQQDTRVKLDRTIFRHAFSYVQSDEKWLPTQSISLGVSSFLKNPDVFTQSAFQVLQLKWDSGGMYSTDFSSAPATE